MAPMKSVMRARRTSSFTWYGGTKGAMREPLSQWTDMESSNGSSTEDFSDVGDNDGRQKFTGILQKANFESEMSDVGECEDRKRFRDSTVKINYDSDSCLTPRSRRTLRRTLSGSTEPWPSVKTPSKPTLDTIFSPTHEILHPLQSLRLERSLSNRSAQSNVMTVRSTKAATNSVKSTSFTLPNPESKSVDIESCKFPESQPNSDELGSFMFLKPQSETLQFDHYTSPRATPVKFESYSSFSPKRNSAELNRYTSPKPLSNFAEFERYTFPKSQSTLTTTLEEETLEQRQRLIGASDDVVESPPQEKNDETETATALVPNIVAIIVDAEKKLTLVALDWAINVAVQPGDEIIILGVLKHIPSPMGYKMVANTDPLNGVNREILESEVNKTTEMFQQKLDDTGRREQCEKKKVKLTVQIAPGARARKVVVRELAALKATYAIFERTTMRSRRYYGRHLSCHAVRMRKNGRSTKTITLVPQKGSPTTPKPRSPISDISSVSFSSRSTDQSPSPTFWRRITSFRSSRRSRTTSPRSSTGSHRSGMVSPSAVTAEPDSFLSEMQDFSKSLDRSTDLDNLSCKLKSFNLGELAPTTCDAVDVYEFMGKDSHRNHRPAISVTIPRICAV